jgi:hypothetical protein
MDTLVFHVEADKLDTNVLESIKAFFGKRKIAISVEPEDVLAELVERGRQSPVSYVVPNEVISRMADALEADEPVDTVAEISEYKQTRPWETPRLRRTRSTTSASGLFTNRKP